jgi:hypothetical protein
LRIVTAAVLAAAVVGPFLWCFGAALFTNRSFAFRDGAHYYYPLFQWTRRQWAAGRIPLWNPQDSCGVPGLADATSSVFYPGKLVFALPLAYPTQYKLYVTGHILLAAAAAFLLARHWRASRYAAGLCAVSYAYGGNVLFQYCNVVYLVGAAWLPLALLAAARMLVGRRLGAAFAFAAVLALIVLGGDPQMAYNAGLLTVLYALLLWRDERRGTVDGGRDPDGADSKSRGGTRHRGVLLAIAAASAVAFSAVQVLPSAQWTKHCRRAAYSNPRSLFEIPGYLARPKTAAARPAILEGFFGSPERGVHDEHIYHFSIGPWRLAELVWPNVCGRMFPQNRRWSNAIPAESRIWTPSLYLGILPLLLGLGAWRVRGGTVAHRWASWTALLGTLAAFGWYGLGWAIHEFRFSVLGTQANDVLIGQPVGGLYWLMVVALPGYAYFRFPAKLMVIASLSLSLLAARGLDGLFARGPRGLRRCLLGLGLFSLAALAVSFGIAPWWETWTRSAPDDALFGPFDASGALGDLRLSFLHVALSTALAWWLLGRWHRWHAKRVAALVLLLAAGDVAVANRWMILTAPQRLFDQRPYYAGRLAESERTRGDGQPFRVFRGTRTSWWPAMSVQACSEQRHHVGLRWDRDTLYPKYHLPAGVALVESNGSCSSFEYLTLLQTARRFGPRRPDGIAEPHAAVIDLLGGKYLLLPRGLRYPGMEIVPPDDKRAAPDNTELWFDPRAFPRAWIVHKVVTLPPLDDVGPTAVETRTREILFPDGVARDFRTTAVVESDVPPCVGDRRAALPGAPLRSAPATRVPESGETLEGKTRSTIRERSPERVDELCRIVRDEPQRVEIDVLLNAPGLVVVSDLFYPGWAAEVTTSHGPTRRVPIVRTNRVMRGVALPAGRHRLVFVYRPVFFYVGAAVSFVSWLGLLVGATACRWRGISRRS